jgi:hypothetical protein
MLHERVYAFLLPMQFSCVLFAGPAISRRQMLGIALALLLVPLAGAAVDGRQFDPIADIAGPPLAFLAAQMALPRAWTIALLLSAACLVTWATILQRRDPFVLGLSVALVFSLVLRAGTYVELRHRHWWPDASGAPTAHLSTVRGPLYVVTDAGIPSLFLSMVDNRVTQVPMRAEQLREAILKSTVPTPLMAVVPGAMAASVLTEYDAVIIAGYPRFNASVVEIRRAP